MAQRTARLVHKPKNFLASGYVCRSVFAPHQEYLKHINGSEIPNGASGVLSAVLQTILLGLQEEVATQKKLEAKVALIISSCYDAFMVPMQIHEHRGNVPPVGFSILDCL